MIVYKVVQNLKLILTIGFIMNISAVYSQELELSNIFSDHMILQREQPVPIWGSASPHEKITVKFAGQTKYTKSDSEGKWMVELNAMEASSVGRELIVMNKNELKISDVLVGEVWICSGQSNMQLEVDHVPEASGLIPFYKNIRSFEVNRTVSFKEENQLKGQWSTSYPNSAVAFSFAYFLNDISEVPVGIILSSWGSSSIEAWTPRYLTEKLPHFKIIMEEFDKDTVTQHRITEIIEKGKDRSEDEDIFLRRQPNILYNAMIKPLIPFACRGVVWYQGERNTRYLSGVPEVTQENWFHRVIGMKEYGGVLKEWALSYRETWANDQLEFMVIMLPGFGRGTASTPDIDPNDPAAESWAWMRESQMEIMDLPYTSIINTIDLGEVDNVHPTDKLPIGQRLALEAAKNIDNKKIVSQGPIMDRVEVKDHSIIVHFKNAKILKTIDDNNPKGFWISNNNKKWGPADAEIINNTVVISSKNMDSPLYVRYAFSAKPNVNLVNEIDLPAFPFRTDNFEN